MILEKIRKWKDSTLVLLGSYILSTVILVLLLKSMTFNFWIAFILACLTTSTVYGVIKGLKGGVSQHD